MLLPARALMIAGWVYLAGYAAWSVTLLGADLPRDSVNDLVFLPFYFGTAGAAFLAAGSPGNDERLARGWRLIGAAWIVSGAGSILWLLYRAMPSPVLDWIAWTVYNGYYPLVLAGLWHFLERPTDRVSRFRLGVEALIAMTATAVLAWYLVFRHNEAVDGASGVLKQIAVLFVGELLIVGAASAVLQRPAPTANVRSLLALGLGAFSAAIADFAYEQDQVLGLTWSSRIGDVLLALGSALIFSAALAWRRRSVTEHPLPVVSRGLTLLPFVAVGVVASLLIWESVQANLGQGPVAGLTIGGAILLVLVIARLLVAQRELGREAAARAAQDARFRSLVERSSDAMLVVTPSGEIRWASPAFGRMVGLPDDGVVGRQLTDFAPAELGDALRAWLAAPKSAVLSAWRLGHAGRWRDVEALGTDLASDPAVGGIVLNVRDVSERVRLESELRQAQQMEAVGRLASSIAHDFNNLLTVILGNIRLINTDDPNTRESLTDAEAATRRGVTLARQLLSLANPVSLSTKVADLSELVRGLDGTIRSVLPGSIALRIETSRDRLAAMVDEVRIEQILLNLSINARDAMPDGGLLEIVVEARAGASGLGEAVVTVRDSGTGMSPDVAARAFEPFFTTKPVGLGTGLGLATVRRLVTELGGQVHLDSIPGRGTAVEVRFALVEARRPAVVADGASAATGGGEGPRLLVVDDEPSVRRVLSRQLSAAGFRVTEAADAVGALAALRTPGLDFDVLLTDLVMPGMRGDDLARQVCRDFPKVKVLCMSGTPAATSAAGGGEPWSTSLVIAKPLDIDEVAARIGAVLDE